MGMGMGGGRILTGNVNRVGKVMREKEEETAKRDKLVLIIFN